MFTFAFLILDILRHVDIDHIIPKDPITLSDDDWGV